MHALLVVWLTIAMLAWCPPPKGKEGPETMRYAQIAWTAQKNGGFSGIQIAVDHRRPRASPKQPKALYAAVLEAQQRTSLSSGGLPIISIRFVPISPKDSDNACSKYASS